MIVAYMNKNLKKSQLKAAKILTGLTRFVSLENRMASSVRTPLIKIINNL